jgi:hypothetical protein
MFTSPLGQSVGAGSTEPAPGSRADADAVGAPGAGVGDDWAADEGVVAEQAAARAPIVNTTARARPGRTTRPFICVTVARPGPAVDRIGAGSTPSHGWLEWSAPDGEAA